MANTFKFGTNGNWAVKDGYALAYNDENNNFKPLPFDFTRASSATRVNKQGLIETVPSGKPRIDFTDNTSGHLLLEPSRINYITQSIDLADWSSFVASGTVTRTNDYSTSPDGKNKATRLQMSGGSSTQWTYLNVSNLATYASFYVKSTGSSSQNFRWFWNNGSNGQDFTATTEWQRFEVAVSQSSTLPMGFTTHSDLSASDILVWGVQSENGSYATSYIPTEGSSVTRVVENTANGGNSQTIGSSTGTVFLDLKDTNTIGGSANTDVMVIKNSSNIALGLYSLFIDSTGNIRLYNITGNTSVTLKSGDNRGQSLKIAFAYANADFVAYVNGVKTFESSSVSLQSGLDFISLNASPNEGLTIVNNVKLYDTRLTNTELQNLTS